VFTVTEGVGEIVTPVTATGLMVTVKEPDCALPSAAVAVTTQLRGKVPVVPAVRVVIPDPSPSVLVGLTESLASQPAPFAHVTFRFVALVGSAVAVSVCVPPATMVGVAGVTALTDTLVTVREVYVTLSGAASHSTVRASAPPLVVQRHRTCNDPIFAQDVAILLTVTGVQDATVAVVAATIGVQVSPSNE
jgi:hypothetical protein